MPAFPQSLTVQPLSLSSSPAGGVAPTGSTLAVTLPLQEHDLWCWAAVGSAVGNFFGTGTWTQCQVATASIPNFTPPPQGTFDCCSNAVPCNIYGYVDVALRSTSSFASKQGTPMSFADLQTEIAASQPVGARLQWLGGTVGHFIALRGWSIDAAGAQWVDVLDPQTGPSTQLLSAFPATYRNHASWTHSYRTHNQTV